MGFNLKEYCFPVKYKSQQYTLKDLESLTVKEFGEIFSYTKAINWEYEKEWRIIIKPDNPNNKKDRILSFSEEMLTGIIFGCLMTYENKKDVLSWLKEWEKKPKIYQAKKDRYNYKLKIETVSFEEL